MKIKITRKNIYGTIAFFFFVILLSLGGATSRITTASLIIPGIVSLGGFYYFAKLAGVFNYQGY